jgi:AcrR family transcriptional regulator
MPKIVDHDTQRERFAEAAIRLIARDGFEGMTMRAVAAEAGLSYGSLFHYFASKDELLIHAVRHLTSQQSRRVNDFSSRSRGLRALQRLLYDDALVDVSSRGEAVVWLAFLARAALDPALARIHSDLIDGWLERIRQMLDEARAAGEIAAGLDTEAEALAIWVYSAGVGQQGLLYPQRFPPARQRKLITAYLDKLRSPAGESGQQGGDSPG